MLHLVTYFDDPFLEVFFRVYKTKISCATAAVFGRHCLTLESKIKNSVPSLAVAIMTRWCGKYALTVWHIWPAAAHVRGV